MMGKASNRKKSRTLGAAEDLRVRVAAEAAKVREGGGLFADPADIPELRALLESARVAMLSALPTSFTHKGETYFLRVSIGLARLLVFDTATAGEPLAVGLSSSIEEHGHAPLH